MVSEGIWREAANDVAACDVNIGELRSICAGINEAMGADSFLGESHATFLTAVEELSAALKPLFQSKPATIPKVVQEKLSLLKQATSQAVQDIVERSGDVADRVADAQKLYEESHTVKGRMQSLTQFFGMVVEGLDASRTPARIEF